MTENGTSEDRTSHRGRRTYLPRASTPVLLVATVVAIALVNHLIAGVVLDRLVTRMFIDMVLVLGLQVFMGNTNILWFPHVGFMGIGAYASVIFSMSQMQKIMSLPELYPFLTDVSMPFLPALLCGALVAAVVAAVIGFPMMRLSDFPAVIAGFALLVVIHVVLNQWTAMTNGPQTLWGIERHTYAVTAAVWACVFIVLAYLFKESKLGLQLRASRDDLTAADAVGVNIVYVRWVGFITSAFIAGIGGGLYAHYITSFTPSAFYLNETFVILAMLVIGGPATVTGAVYGVIIVTVIHQSLRWAENTINTSDSLAFDLIGVTEISLGVIMIAVLILRPGGIFERLELTWTSPRTGWRQLTGKDRSKSGAHARR